ncbi:MAG: hypothetical protein AB7O49_20225 [Sphingomonadales bacterium]
MNRTMKFMLPLVAAAFVAGCGQDAADTAAEKIAKQHGIDMDIDRDGDKATYTVSGPGGGTVQMGENLSVPDGFPDDVAVYPDLKIVSASSMPQGYMVHGQTTDAIDKVAGFYADKMTSDGWEKESEMTAQGMRTMSFKKEGRNAAVNVFSGDEGTTVQLTAMTTGS